MKGRAAAILAAALWGSPAAATGEITCHGPEGVGIDLLVGHVDYLYIDRVIVTAGGKTWSSHTETMPGEPISVVQAYEDERQMLVDFGDGGAVRIGSLRVFKLGEGFASKAGGVFQMSGEGVWVVDCSDPE